MIKAVIFDLGGVLIDFPIPKMIEFCAGRIGISQRDLIRGARGLRKEFQEGAISEEEFWDRVCQATGGTRPRGGSLWEEAFRDAYREKDDVFCIVRELQARYFKVALLSNTEHPSIRCLDPRTYDFDALVYSCVEGVSKPGPQIYAIALERLGIAPGEAVFVDDQAENVEGALDAGMQGILFRGSGRLRECLASLGVEI